MPNMRVKKFSTSRDLEVFLQGGVWLGAPALEQNRHVADIVGKTLIFTKPSSVTVTFTDVAGRPSKSLLMSDIAAQIRAAFAGALSVGYDPNGQRMFLVETSPSQGVTIDGAGTANALLGATAAVGKFYAPPAQPYAAPCLISVFGTGNGQYEVVTYE